MKGSVDVPTKEAVQTLRDDVKLEIIADEAKEGAWRVQPGNIAVLDIRQVCTSSYPAAFIS